MNDIVHNITTNGIVQDSATHRIQDDALIHLENLAVLVKDTKTVLVEPLRLTLHKGHALTILGETGSGKSLLAQAIMGALPEELMTTGQVFFEGKVLDNATLKSLWGRKLAMLTQEPTCSLDPTMTIFEQVFEGFYFVSGKDKAEAKQRTYSILEQLGLEGFEDYYSYQLSGGMAQRVAFGIASAGGANVVIADEPTKGLDAHNRQVIIDLLKSIVQNGGTLLTITHDIEVAEGLSKMPKSTLMVMKKGILLEQGDAKMVLARPKSEYASLLIQSAPYYWKQQGVQKTYHDTSNNLPLLTVTNLAVARGKRTLFDKLNFSLNAGEVLGLVGHSGIGKSSLGDVLCGILKPKKGNISWSVKAQRHQVLKLYQDPPSAFANHVPLQVLLDDVIAKHALDCSCMPFLLQSLQLDSDLLCRTASNVSGGELQRIAILRALILNPVLLFADEVTSRLDPITQKQTMDLLTEQCRVNKCALVVVSHDPDLTEYYCDRVLDLTTYVCH